MFTEDMFVGDMFVGDMFVGDMFVGDMFVGDMADCSRELPGSHESQFLRCSARSR
jgi:hypothetical protein